MGSASTFDVGLPARIFVASLNGEAHLVNNIDAGLRDFTGITLVKNVTLRLCVVVEIQVDTVASSNTTSLGQAHLCPRLPTELVKYVPAPA